MSSNYKLTLAHEKIEISDSKIQTEVIRPDRIHMEDRDCQLEVSEKLVKVLNFSPFGLATSIELAEFLNKDSMDGRMFYANQLICRIRFTVVRVNEQGDSGAECGLEILGEPIQVDKIYAIQATEQIKFNQTIEHQKSALVPNDFRVMIYDMKDWLCSLEDKLAVIENDYSLNGMLPNNQFSHALADQISMYLKDFFGPKYAELAGILSAASKEEFEASFLFFRKKIGGIICQAPFVDRIVNKPLGYAGDYEMMNIIYKNQYIGRNLFAQCLHKYFVEDPAAEAVRNRAKYLVDSIISILKDRNSSEPFKILSVASGPAMEVQRLMIENDAAKLGPIEFHFIDQDLSALKHAQSQLRTLQMKYGLPWSFTFTNLAIRNIISHGLQDSDYDLIYSAGLFDYLSVNVAKDTAKKLYQGLKEKGTMIIGNYGFSNPTQFLMDIALDWHLIYRTSSDLKEIFEALPGASIDVEEEPLGINLFARIEK